MSYLMHHLVGNLRNGVLKIIWNVAGRNAVGITVDDVAKRYLDSYYTTLYNVLNMYSK